MRILSLQGVATTQPAGVATLEPWVPALLLRLGDLLLLRDRLGLKVASVQREICEPRLECARQPDHPGERLHSLLLSRDVLLIRCNNLGR